MKRVLIANRGEIAVRVIRACRDHGIESVAVYSDEDRNSIHASMADAAYSLKGVTAAQTYLNIEKLIEYHALFIKKQGFDIFNVGTGIGKSVLEIISEFPDLKYNIEPRRSGDVSSLVCSISKLQEYQWSI